MNLIERLGGYEKAKAFLNATSFTIDELIMMQRSGLRTQHVEKALLEYRRQHNIYEVGDLIIDACIGNSVIKYHGGYDNHENWVSCFVRHATDAEIKAGKRLEVNQ